MTSIRTKACLFAGAFASLFSTVSPANAYQIDCAILLCMAGGFPTSAPCTAARAEMIRRITPWPIEPPLQLWRCPMHAVFKRGREEDLPLAKVHEAAQLISPAQIDGSGSALPTASALPAFIVPASGPTGSGRNWRAPLLPLVQAATNGQADIDISGPEFDFVRSIRVWHILAYQYSGRQCSTVIDRAELGTYDRQGAYAWVGSSTFRTPSWMRPARLQKPPTSCRSHFYRAIGVEWRDYTGNPGHEVIPY